MDLAIEAAEQDYRLLHVGETGSTNDDALDLARQGDPGRLWIVADRQIGGRGRHGRQWESPTGNLYASLLLVNPCPAAEAVQLAFLSGLALHDAVQSLAPTTQGRFALKWPNDLLCDKAKLAGLLLDGQHGPGKTFSLVIGFGVNVGTAPSRTPYPAARLRDVVPEATPSDLFGALSGAFARRFLRWEADSPVSRFASIRGEWLTRAAGLGETVTLRLPQGPLTGRFAGLDHLGRLRLETGGELRVVDAGDLFFANLLTSSDVRPPGDKE